MFKTKSKFGPEGMTSLQNKMLDVITQAVAAAKRDKEKEGSPISEIGSEKTSSETGVKFIRHRSTRSLQGGILLGNLSGSESKFHSGSTEVKKIDRRAEIIKEECGLKARRKSISVLPPGLVPLGEANKESGYLRDHPFRYLVRGKLGRFKRFVKELQKGLSYCKKIAPPSENFFKQRAVLLNELQEDKPTIIFELDKVLVSDCDPEDNPEFLINSSSTPGKKLSLLHSVSYHSLTSYLLFLDWNKNPTIRS
jgi:hypothetical protein